MLVGAVVALIHYATSPAPVAWPDGGFYLPPPPAALQQIYDNLCTVVNIEALVGTQSQTDDDATVDVAPLPQPEPFGQPNPIDPHTREDDED